METNIEDIYTAALGDLASVEDPGGLEKLHTLYLGRKGRVSLYLRGISGLPVSERAQAGQKGNEIKKALEEAFARRLQSFADRKSRRIDAIDVSLPGRRPSRGTLHPITRITARICDIFARMGFDVVEGPEVENEYYNFEALNIPRDHPARDMQDTFYISDGVVLRTHTSPVQIRVMKERTPPVRIVAPGKVYRRDSDITHTPMFHQVEGLLVDKDVSFGDLKGILTAFVHEMFDSRTSLRFRPSFFPFTEPSAEVDILCVMCRGAGCRVCSQSGWLEILGSGMVHPALYENVGYDPREVTGFAFGMGVERIAMLKYGIDDIRRFYENDYRFLRQFHA